MKEPLEIDKQLVALIKEDNEQAVKELLEELHPADIAELLQDLDDDEAKYVVAHLDAEIATHLWSLTKTTVIVSWKICLTRTSPSILWSTLTPTMP